MVATSRRLTTNGTYKVKLYAESVLIGSQWQTNKTLSINKQGFIESIDDGCTNGAETIKGAVIPGMVNCHSHAFQRAFAGFSEYRANNSDSFWSWRDIMYRFVAKMTPEDVFAVARYLYLEMLKTGYTSVAEFHYLHHQANGQHYANQAEMSHQVIQASIDTGLTITHLPVLYTYAGFGQLKASSAQARFIHQTDDYCYLLESLNKHYINHPTVHLGIAPHSLRAVSKEQLHQVIPFARQLNPQAPIHIHIAEQLKEVEDSLSYYGKRPVEWLLDNFKLDKNWCLIHATHLTKQEIKHLAKSQAVAGICPTTEANLGDGIFPTSDYMQQGGRVAIGSDSHIAVNVADELRSLEYVQRLTQYQRAVLCNEQCPSVGQNLYLHAAKSGADSINQPVGEIAVGKRADLVVLNTQHPSLYAKPNQFILDAAIFACDKLPVRDVMVAGKWQIKAGFHLQEKAFLADYLKVIKKLSQDS